MSTFKPIYYTFAVLAIILGVYACDRDDIDPDEEELSYSRLYVSFEEFESTGEVPDTNVRIIQPADSSVFAFSENHVSTVEGGSTIYFNPFLRALFQASLNQSDIDTVISVMDVTRIGLLNNSGSIESRYYTDVKGFTYHSPTSSLFAVNGSGPDAGIYVIDQPRTANGNKQPRKRLRNADLDMWGAAFEDNRLFTSKLNAPVGIYVFEGLTRIPVGPDSVAALHPTRNLEIPDATNLRGLFYDTIKNVMAVTDIGDGQTLGTGRILIFDNFSSLIHEAGVITPTRVITGANTGLISPVDVAIDTRETGVYLYVADRTARKVSRFRYTDDGNVEPDDVIETSELPYGITPVGLSLDARDRSNVPDHNR